MMPNFICSLIYYSLNGVSQLLIGRMSEFGAQILKGGFLLNLFVELLMRVLLYVAHPRTSSGFSFLLGCSITQGSDY